MHKDDLLFEKLLEFDLDVNRGMDDVPSFLHKHYEQYIEALEEAVNGNNPFLREEFISKVRTKIPEIKYICNQIVEIGHTIRAGKTKQAYLDATELFNELQSILEADQSWTQYFGYYCRIRSGDFRIKPCDDSKSKKTELFHIKDHQRGLIKSFRYSISGYPCLYLAGSYQLAWYECEMPTKFSYCEFQFQCDEENRIKLFDMSKRPRPVLEIVFTVLSNQRDNTEIRQRIFDYLLNYILCYPLFAACSLKVISKNINYIEEYVLPQMFMQWIQENGEYDGVIYNSSAYTSLIRGISAKNIALPAKKFRSDGLCEYLTSKLLVSDIGYLDVSEEFEKYKVLIQQLDEYKGKIWFRIKHSEQFVDETREIIKLCETISLTFNQVITGMDLDMDIILHQIESIADHVDRIYNSKEQIISNFRSKVEKEGNTKNLDNTIEQFEEDIENFYSISNQIVQRSISFTFEYEELQNFEKI
jgi:hypothetical protein